MEETLGGMSDDMDASYGIRIVVSYAAESVSKILEQES